MNSQQTSYLLLRGNQNRQIHLQPSMPTTILQVPVLYEQGYYVEEHCHCHCDDRYNDEARKRYVVESMTKGITDLGVSIAELITVCNKNKEKKAEAKAEAENKKLEAENQSNLDSLKAQISEASKKLEALSSANPKDETTPIGGVSPASGTSSTSGTSSASGTSPASGVGDNSFSEKWKNVDIEYKEQCANYVKAVKSFKYTDQAIIGAKLQSISENAQKGINEIDKYLKGDNVTEEEKKIGAEAKKKLEEIKNSVKETLSTKPPKASEEQEPSEFNGKSKYNSIDEAKAQAEKANTKFNSTKNPEDQKNAVIAYNEYAITVLDESKNKNLTRSEYLEKITECDLKMNFLIYYNKSPYVKDQIADSKKLAEALWNLSLKLKAEDNKEYRDELSLSYLLSNPEVC